MKLVSFGDSFVEGLIKEPQENSIEERDQICFTRKIYENSEIFDSYVNYGTRGSGNESIIYNAYKHMNKFDQEDSFYLICLSGLERCGWYIPDRDAYDISNQKGVDFEPFFQTQMLMTGIHTVLKNKGIPHLFTSSFTPFYMFYNKYTVPPEYIIGDIDSANSLFDIISGRFNNKIEHFGNYKTSHVEFFNVPKSKNIAKCLHPSIQGHKVIASALLPYIHKHIHRHKKEIF